MIGRPTVYTLELGLLICEELAKGRSLRSICEDEEMPGQTTIYRWVQTNDEFREQYTQARVLQAETLLDECQNIADDGSNDYYEVVSKSGEVYSKFDQEHWQRSKLRIETRHWMIELLAPKKYGANANQQPQEIKQLEPVKVEIVGKYDPDRKGN